MLVPALSHPTEALGQVVWDFGFDSHHTSTGLCWLDFISPCRAGRGRRSWSLPALQGSVPCSTPMECPMGWWHPGAGDPSGVWALHVYHCILPCAGHGVTDHLKLEGIHKDHRVQLLGH